MKNSILKTILFSLTVILAACNQVKENQSDSVFVQFSPNQKEYKNELAKKIKANPQEFTYTLLGYTEQNGKEYINVQINGNDFVASGLVLVGNWSKMQGIKKTKVVSYVGAGLKGLQIDVVEHAAGANLVYSDLDKIVD
jgi:ABC-type phosphate transport system substrate-binding protein